MKKFFLLSLAFLSFSQIKAQETATEDPSPFKRFYINAGTNIVDHKNNYPYLSNNANLFNGSLGLEYKFKDESSIGINFMYQKSLTFYNLKNSSMGVDFTFNHDWSEKLGLNTKKFDVYTGFNFSISQEKKYYLGSVSSGGPAMPYIQKLNGIEAYLGGQIGVRYFIFKNIGLNAELNRSFNSNNVKVGATIRL